MKTTLHLASLLLLALLIAPCLGMISVKNVSAKCVMELGVEIRGTANGPKEAWIEMTFKAEGELKDFQHVSIEIRDGDQFLLGWTPLEAKRMESGKMRVGLMGNREFLKKVTLRIVCGATGEVGHDLRMKDFVDLANLK